MSRSCQSATSSSAARRVRAQQAREAAQVLRQDRVLLVRHRRRALLPLAERLRRLAHLGALPVAHGERDPLDGGAEPRQRHEVGRRGDRARRSGSAPSRGAGRASPSAALSIAGLEVGVGADRAGDLADRDLVARGDQRAPRAPELGVEAREHQPGRDRLGVDAVRAADRRRRAVLLGAPAAGRAQQVDAGQDLVRRLDQRGSPATRRARPTTSSRGAASAPARPPAPRRGSGTRSRRGGCAPRARGCAPGSSLPAAFARTAAAVPAGTVPAALHLGAGGQLDAQPGLVAVAVGPQLEQLRARVAGDHRSAPVLTKTRRRFKRVQGMSTVDPIVLRASRSRCAAPRRAAGRSARPRSSPRPAGDDLEQPRRPTATSSSRVAT